MIVFQDTAISGAQLVGSSIEFTRAGSVEAHALSGIQVTQGGTASGTALSCNAVSVVMVIAGASYPAAMCLKTFQDMKHLSAYQPNTPGTLQRFANGAKEKIQRAIGASCCGG